MPINPFQFLLIYTNKLSFNFGYLAGFSDKVYIDKFGGSGTDFKDRHIQSVRGLGVVLHIQNL